MAKGKKANKGSSAATVGFEQQLWAAADALRNNMDAAEYRAANIFWVPKEARWAHLEASAPQPTIGKLVDDAMAAVEGDNPSLKGVLPKDYARPGLDKERLGQLIKADFVPANLAAPTEMGNR